MQNHFNARKATWSWQIWDFELVNSSKGNESSDDEKTYRNTTAELGNSVRIPRKRIIKSIKMYFVFSNPG